jgi:acylglycerol lipase
MGAAVILVAAGGGELEEIAGLVLVAPAVWGWSVMNPALAGFLQLLAYAVPAMPLPAPPLRALASDNTAMLEALERDPLVLQKVRIDALYGLVTLMDQALAAAGTVKVPTLALYGANERLIPWKAQVALFQRLPADHRIVIYPAGHHTLLRDLEAARVHDDVTKWIRECPHKAPVDLASAVTPRSSPARSTARARCGSRSPAPATRRPWPESCAWWSRPRARAPGPRPWPIAPPFS